MRAVELYPMEDVGESNSQSQSQLYKSQFLIKFEILCMKHGKLKFYAMRFINSRVWKCILSVDVEEQAIAQQLVTPTKY